MINKCSLFTMCIAIIMSFIGCSGKDTINIVNNTNDTIIASEEPYMNSGINTDNKANKKVDLEVIRYITNKLHTINIKDCWVGYNSEKNISIWVNSSDRKAHESIDILSTKYHAFIVKKIFENIKDVKNIWSMKNYNITDYSLYSMNEEAYLKSGLKGTPSDPDEFNSIERSWKDVADKYNILDCLVVVTGEKYDPQIAFQRQIKELYGDRLKDVCIEDHYMGAINVKIAIDGLPQDISVNDEIAKVLVLGMGRFSENLPFDNIYNMQITYNDNTSALFQVTAKRGVEQEPSQDFIRWHSSGLNSKDWINYANIKTFDSDFMFPEVTDNVSLNPGKAYDDPGYEKVMDTLKGCKGVKDLVLGYDGTTYNALIIMEYTREEEDFQNEMDITHEAMKYPFETIWFMVEDSNGTTKNMALMDRERYNILNYMNDSDKFDFIPEEWPIMVKAFGEVE